VADAHKSEIIFATNLKEMNIGELLGLSPGSEGAIWTGSSEAIARSHSP
jgi:hypothetical protein